MATHETWGGALNEESECLIPKCLLQTQTKYMQFDLMKGIRHSKRVINKFYRFLNASHRGWNTSEEV